MVIETSLTKERIDQHTADGGWLNRTWVEFLDQNVRIRPDKIILMDSKRRISNIQLDLLVKRLALSFAELEIKNEDMVIIMLPSQIEFVATAMALNQIGAIIVPVGVDYPIDELKQLAQFTEAKAIITCSKFGELEPASLLTGITSALPNLEHVIVDGDEVSNDMVSLKEMAAKPLETKYREDYLAQFKPSPNDIFGVLFTSGTTGTPKGVMHTYNTFASFAYWLGTELTIRHDDVGLDLRPVFTASGLANMAACAMTHGSTFILTDYFVPEQIVETIEREKVTFICGGATQFIELLNAPNIHKHDISSVRFFFSFGAPVPYQIAKELEEKFEALFVMGWGTLETLLKTEILFTDPIEVRYRTAGHVRQFEEVKAVDIQGNEVPADTPGELLCKGAGNFVGYYKAAELNEMSMTKDGWFRPGDVGIFDKTGILRIIGRTSDTIIKGGQSIYPAEIEGILIEHSKVHNVSIIGMPDPELGERCCAYIILKSGETVTLEEVLSFLKGKVTDYSLPDRLEIVDSFLLGPSAKVLKTKLREDITGKLRAEAGI